MRIRTRIFFGILTVVGVGFYLFFDWIVDDLTPQYRESTEEPLVDSARTLAALAAATADSTGEIDVELFRRALANVRDDVFEAKIFEFTKTMVDFRVYITDAKGVVIFDSRTEEEGNDEGEDYSRWRDVYHTLAGGYGARTTHEVRGGATVSILYVAAPIVRNGEIAGVLTVGKPTVNANQFIELATKKILVGSAVSAIAVVLVGLLVSEMITRPVRLLTDYAGEVGRGRRVALPRLGGSEIAALGAAFERMRSALEGKQYVEQYVQSLTHEIKSPLSAIQGAVELIDDEMPAEKRRRFLENIRLESQRIAMLVEKLLLLARLENRAQLEEEAVEEIDLRQLAEEVVSSVEPIVLSAKLELSLVAPESVLIRGDRFLLRQAVLNLVNNAVEFSSECGRIEIAVGMRDSMAFFTVNDAGPGIPEYALLRVFERFYSLKRPGSGRKSSGLGLSLVREVAELHNGRVSITNRSSGGVCAELALPLGGARLV